MTLALRGLCGDPGSLVLSWCSCHSRIASPSMWLGYSEVLASCSPVTGDAVLPWGEGGGVSDLIALLPCAATTWGLQGGAVVSAFGSACWENVLRRGVIDERVESCSHSSWCHAFPRGGGTVLQCAGGCVQLS